MDHADYKRLYKLLEPCLSPEDLDEYLINNFQIALPWDVVDRYSTSSSLKFLWDIYQVMLTDNGAHRHVAAAARNSAKCISEGTLVGTPSGPVEIQNLKAGDTVYDEHGDPVKVLALWDQGEQDCVNFENHGRIWATCTPNHRWQTYDQRRPDTWKIRTGEKKFPRDVRIRRVEINSDMGWKNIPEAYAIGAMLGDGCKSSGSMEISSKDPEIPNKVAEILGTIAKKAISNNHTWRILCPPGHKQHTRWVWSKHYEEWCRGRLAHKKTCDLEELKKWNRESLLGFVAGVIDTDGSIFVPKKFNTGQLNIQLGMQAKDVVDAIAWLFMALWQAPVKVNPVDRDHYVNGTYWEFKLAHNYHNKRILKELSPYLQLDRKKYKQEYDDFKVNNFNPSGVGMKISEAGKKQCWDITVDSPTSLFLLQNGLVTHNTLTSSMIQYFSLLHFRRDGLHLAATLDQSSALIKYIDKFLRNPLLVPYTDTDNVRQKKLVNMPANDFTSRGDAVLQVATATKKGVNSQRSSVLTFDETDLTPPEILSEAAYIADPARIHKADGSIEKFGSIFIYLSSRKTNNGSMQELIDEAEDPDNQTDFDPIILHKWATVDWMKNCPPDVHKPELGEIDAFIHTETLKTIWNEESYNLLTDAQRNQYMHTKAFEGCIKCPAWIACQGQSAHQRGTSHMLRDRFEVGRVMKAVKDPASIISQALNWRPESTALVFKAFSAYHHIKAPRDFYEWVTFGNKFNPMGFPDEEIARIERAGTMKELMQITPTKEQIYEAMCDYGWIVTGGVDGGYDPDPAICVVGGYHKKAERCAVLHVEHSDPAAGYKFANHVWAEHVAKEVYSRFPMEYVAPDLADPAFPSYFAKHNIKSLSKKPKRIETGISQIRGLLWDASDNSSKFCILDDGEFENKNKFMVHEMKTYSHARDAVGKIIFDKFSDNNNHSCFTEDALVEIDSGFKKICDIAPGDMVLTHTGKYKRVKSVMQRDYKGEILKIRPYGRESISCTPQHPFLVQMYFRSYKEEKTGQLDKGKRCWLNAKELTKTEKNAQNKQSLVYIKPIECIHDRQEYIIKDGLDRISRNQKYKWRQTVKITNNLSFLLGYYLAEGSSSSGKTQRNINFAMHTKEYEFSSKIIKAMLDEVYLYGKPKAFSEIEGNKCRIMINSNPLWEIFSKFGVKTNKSLPGWVFDTSKLSKWYILVGYLYGDGTFKNKGIRSGSVSRILSYQIYKIALSLGLSVKIRKALRKGRWVSSPGCNDQWIVEFSRNSSIVLYDFINRDEYLRPILDIKKSFLFTAGKMPSYKMREYSDETNFLIRDVSSEDFSGTVYNLEVDGDNSYTVNGVVVHNCDALRYLLAPYASSSQARVSVSSTDAKLSEGEIKRGVMSSDPNAIKQAEQKSELRQHFADHIQKEFGIENAFLSPSEVIKKQEEARKGGKKKGRASTGGSGIKFSF